MVRATARPFAAATGAVLLLCGVAACDGGGGGTEARGVPGISAAALQGAATEPEVKAFYEARQWRGAWTEGEARNLMQALEAAPQHGLDPAAFLQLIEAAKEPAAREAQMTLAALRYAKALAVGAVDPEKLHEIYALDRPKVDIPAGLAQALQTGGLAAWLASLPPQDPEYQALSKSYMTYRTLANQAAAAPVAAGPEIRVGAQDPRVAVIAERLANAGYLAAPAATLQPAAATTAPAAPVFTREMSEALKLLQHDADIPVTGRIDAATIQAINQAPGARARQLAVNLERRRWLARNPPATRIDVNTAAAQMVYLRQGQVAWASRTVVGSPENATPALGGAFKQLVVNPPWNVPQGIAEEEIFPKGAGYMERNNMYVENGRVVQRPGPETALGAVKFDMQNEHAIYLHDTPAKALFQTDDRHRSHGCVRVERAVEFARMLAAERGQAEKFDASLAAGETGTVALGEEIPVRLLYHSAYLDGDKLIFGDDHYDWDDKVGQAMGLAPLTRQRGEHLAAVLGP